jgi:DNA-directed RNA polymerase I, II, and III subunit RPABC4
MTLEENTVIRKHGYQAGEGKSDRQNKTVGQQLVGNHRRNRQWHARLPLSPQSRKSRLLRSGALPRPSASFFARHQSPSLSPSTATTSHVSQSHPSHTSAVMSQQQTSNNTGFQVTNQNTFEDTNRSVKYLCGDCDAEVSLKRGDPIRCKECGYRVLYKQRTNRYVLTQPTHSQHLF